MFAGNFASTHWGGVVTLLADQLGVKLETIRETHDVATLDRDVEVAFGVVEAGTVSAIRFEVQGIVNGRPAIVIEHSTRIHEDAAPDWPACAGGDNCYKVILEGRPRLVCELDMADERGHDGGLIACAMRVVNAIPAVCEAAPGLLSTLDVTGVVGRNVRF